MKLELIIPDDVQLFSLLLHSGTQPNWWLAGVKPANGSEWRAFCTGSARAPTPQEAIDKAVIRLNNDIAAIASRGFKPQPSLTDELANLELDL